MSVSKIAGGLARLVSSNFSKTGLKNTPNARRCQQTSHKRSVYHHHSRCVALGDVTHVATSHVDRQKPKAVNSKSTRLGAGKPVKL